MTFRSEYRGMLRRRRGQAMVEFALVMPILLLLLLGILDFARAWNLKQALSDASREGARRAAVYDPALTQAQIESAVRQRVSNSGFDVSRLQITWPDGYAGVGRGEPVSVRVEMPYRWQFVRPFARFLGNANGEIQLSTVTRMRKE